MSRNKFCLVLSCLVLSSRYLMAQLILCLEIVNYYMISPSNSADPGQADKGLRCLSLSLHLLEAMFQ